MQEHEKKKTRKYHQQIGKHYNMEKIETTDSAGTKIVYFKCHDNRKLKFVRYEIIRRNDFTRRLKYMSQKTVVDAPTNQNAYTDMMNKKIFMKINEVWEELKKESEKNVLNEKGIKNRQIRPIQTEGHFGNMKESNRLRRFNHRSRE